VVKAGVGAIHIIIVIIGSWRWWAQHCRCGWGAEQVIVVDDGWVWWAGRCCCWRLIVVITGVVLVDDNDNDTRGERVSGVCTMGGTHLSWPLSMMWPVHVHTWDLERF